MFYTAKIWDFLIKILRIFTLCCIFIFRRGNILSFLQKIPPTLLIPQVLTPVSQYYLRHIYFIFLDRLLQQKKNCPQQRAIKINLFFIACLRPCFVPVFAVLRTFWQNQPAA